MMLIGWVSRELIRYRKRTFLELHMALGRFHDTHTTPRLTIQREESAGGLRDSVE